MTVSNILDPVHDGLSPFVWDEPDSTHPILKKQHRDWIKRQIYAALARAGYTDISTWLSLCLTGSLTTYQYSDDSDVDVSLFVDTKVFPDWSRAEMIAVMVEDMDGTKLPGTPFPMQDFVVPQGIEPKDLYKPGLRSGYDIDKGEWIVAPERSRVHDVEAEENGFYVYALQMADKMEKLLKYEPDKAVQFWHQIHARRQRDQRAGKGDYAESNVVYKFLANRGLFPAISEVSGEYIARRTAMAADPRFIQEWIKSHGPYLYHGAHPRGGEDPEVIAQKILQEGIVPKPYEEPPWMEIAPWTAEEEAKGVRSDENYDEHDAVLEEAWHTPRPHHVYLAPSAYEAYGPPTFRVDLRKLDPRNLNPDEDYMRDNRAPTHWKQHLPPRTLGEQAETYDWSHPGDVEGSLWDRGVAHRGPIPPDAIERVDNDPNWDPYESDQYLSRIGAWNDHFVNQIRPIADAYERMPMYDPKAVPAWQELAADSRRRAAQIAQRLNVQVTDEPEPYANHQEMFNDINQGNFKVSRANSEHPVWSTDDNVAFRTVHDVEGHHPSGGDFGWQGENAACGAHFPTLSPEAQKALMTECLGQTGYAIHKGGFGPQKVGFMDQFIQPAQQAYNTNKGTFSGVPDQGFCHRHIRHGIYRLDPSGILKSDGQTTENSRRGSHQSTLAQSPQGDGQAQIDEPYFPTIEDAVEANRAALAGWGQSNHALLRPEVLEGALGRAQNQYHYTGSMANAAAAIAHGVGQAQAFEDGNKRTAYWLTHHFLHENGYGRIAPSDDEELADHLIGYGEGTHTMENTATMLRGRDQTGTLSRVSGREVAKFVYHPHQNHLVLGEMGREEGEKPSHYQLASAHFPQGELPHLAWGQVAKNGDIQCFSRPKITPGVENGNSYKLDYLTQEAVRRALPGARGANERLNPEWGLPDDPQVTHVGEPPQIDTAAPQEDVDWSF